MRALSFAVAAVCGVVATMDIFGYPAIGRLLEPGAAQARLAPAAPLTFSDRFESAANPHGVARAGKAARIPAPAAAQPGRGTIGSETQPTRLTKPEPALEGCDRAYSPLSRLQASVFIGRCLT